MLRLLAIIGALLAYVATAGAAPHAAWIDDAVVYGVIPNLFGPRGLADVTSRLDAIAALGVTVLWLSPITEAPKGDFGYAVTDPFRIRSDIGSPADLRALVRGAHARGLKVILDVPANDLSDRHPYYEDVLRRGRASRYWDFFARDGDGAITHYFDWTNLENLNYQNPVVRRYVTAAFVHWLRDFDVDGFRVDAAWGPRQRSPDFWPSWSAAMRRVKPDILLLAEGSEHDQYYAAAGFDAAYDWTDAPGHWAWQRAFAARAPAPLLRRALAVEDDRAPIFRFLDNNDTGERFITRHGIGMTRVALAMLMTLPGLPCLYMGDENGAAFQPYAASRPITWTDPHHLRGYVRRLIHLRHAESVLRSHDMRLVRTSDDSAVLAYLRPGTAQDGDVLVLLNYSGTPVDVSIPDRAELGGIIGGGAITDLLDDTTLTLDPANPQIALPPFTARILRRASMG